jgi:hypothetical protein
MLNFAKAELLEAHPNEVTGKIYHGLSFDPSAARTVAGDRLVIHNGVFMLLYEHRTGRTIADGTVLPVKQLLSNIPEIGQQVADAGLGLSRTAGFLHMVASNGQHSWPILAVIGADVTSWGATTRRLFFSVFEEVDSSSAAMRSNLRDHFAISRRAWFGLSIYQARDVVPNAASGDVDLEAALEITWRIKDLLGLRTDENVDGYLVPSLYSRELLIMPPSLCRYAISFYASSLVRYRPYMFDAERYPEQAYMFDAIARECALPMLLDTFSGLEKRANFFYAPDAMRL